MFARDEHGNVKRKQPCQTPGCDHPNWHICLKGKPDTTAEILAERRKRGARKGGTLPYRSDAHREAISESQKERWRKVREANRARDEKIVSRYAEGEVSIRMLTEEFDLGYRAIVAVLKEAQKRGEITLRKRGVTLARRAK